MDYNGPSKLFLDRHKLMWPGGARWRCPWQKVTSHMGALKVQVGGCLFVWDGEGGKKNRKNGNVNLSFLTVFCTVCISE